MDIRLRNLSDLDFDLSRSKVTMVTVPWPTGLPIYGFILMLNSNIWPNMARLKHISIQNE